MKPLLSIFILALFCMQAFADTVNIGITEPPGGADGYAVYVRDYTHGYNYASPTLDNIVQAEFSLTLPGDRESAYIVRAYRWGPYDLQGNRTRVWSVDSNEETYTPAMPEPPQPPVIVRILLAVLDFFAPSFG